MRQATDLKTQNKTGLDHAEENSGRYVCVFRDGDTFCANCGEVDAYDWSQI